jgi:AcrR family transcriptional regulator
MEPPLPNDAEHRADSPARDTGEARLDAPGRRRLRPEERRDEIMDAALAVFAASGFSHTTLNEVADHAGVTKGCLYHHFDSKEQLLRELIRTRLVRTPVGPAEPATATGVPAVAAEGESPRMMVERIWEHSQRPGQVELALLVLSELGKLPELGQFLFDEVVRPGRERVRAALAGAPESCNASDETLAVAAALVPAMVMGVAFTQHAFRSVDPDGPDADRLARAVSTFLTGGIERLCAESPVDAAATETVDA